MKFFITNIKTKVLPCALVRLYACALVFLCSCALAYQAFAQDKIIAIVNNDVITQKDLKDFENFMRIQLSAEYKGQDLEKKIESIKTDLLNKLMEDRLIIFEAKKNDVKADDNRIKAKINDIKKHYDSEDEFQESLKGQGMVQADLEARIKEQMLMYSIIDSQVRSKISISPSDITAYYQKNIEQFKSPKEWELDALAMESADLAAGIYEIIKSGKSFNETAKQNSLTIHRIIMSGGQFKKELEDIILRLKPQEVSEPTKIENKYYIFTLNKFTLEHQMSLAEAMDTIYNFLYANKMQLEMAKWLDNLKKKAYIEVMQE